MKNNLIPLLGGLVLNLSILPLTASDTPIIAELVANNTKFEDEDTDSPAWFELYNPSNETFVLDDWKLTNSKDDLGLWTIKHLTLEPNETRLIFASGKDRPLTAETPKERFLHTNFGLPNGGGFLALVRPDGQTIASSIEYPALEKNLAFGQKGDEIGYYFPATPGENSGSRPSKNGLTPSVVLSHPGGVIDGPIELTLSVPDHPEATIRYALGEQDPSIFTPSYTGPIKIEKNTRIRALASLPGHLPSRISGSVYLVMDEDMRSFAETSKVFESNLPVIVIETFGERVSNDRNFKRVGTVIVEPDSESGRTVLTDEAVYAGASAVHMRGESSSGFGQKSYALEIQDEDGDDRDQALMGMPAESDWAIYGPWSEKSLIRNKLVFDWMRELRGDDGTSVRTAFCEVFLNERSDTELLSYSSYQGVHLLVEKIKRGRDRVPIENLNEHTIDPAMIKGGYIFRQDKPDSGKTQINSSFISQNIQSFDPDRLNTEQKAFLQSQINNLERALRSDDRQEYQNFIEPDTFIDAQWLLEVSKQVDGYVFSTYWHKSRNGKIRAGPLWDFNISLGNADYATGDRSKGWLYDAKPDGFGRNWYTRLHLDPEYHMAHWDRYWHMRQTIFSDEAIDATINKHMETLLDGSTEPVINRAPESLQNPVARHFRRYPFIGNRQWPNPATETRMETWQDEVNFLRDWLKERLEWLDDQGFVVDKQIHRAPLFSQYGGEASPGFALTIERHKGGLFDSFKFPDAPIYYTTDGSDPRLAGGEINPVAQITSDPIVLQQSTTVRARMLNGETWSPETAVTFLIGSVPASAENLVITELLYNPEAPTGIEAFRGFNSSSVFEFLELTNISNQVVDLKGLQFTRGIVFNFDGLTNQSRLLGPGETVVIVKNREAFLTRNKDISEGIILGEYQSKLSNGGERLTLLDAQGEDIADFSYDDGGDWPDKADGEGYSLVFLEPSKNGKAEEASNWAASSEIGGTPGTAPLGDPVDPGGFVGDPTKDSDGDGYTDFVEYASGSDPEDAKSFYPSVVHLEDVEGFSNIVLEQRRDPEAKVSFSLEISTDLQTWEPDPVSELFRTQDNGDGTESLFLRAWNPVNEGEERYLRVKIEGD